MKNLPSSGRLIQSAKLLAVVAGALLAPTAWAQACVTSGYCAVQARTFSNVTGVQASDILIAVSKPMEPAGLSVTPGHITGASTLTVNFCNNASSAMTPTVSQSYNFMVVQ